MLMTSAREYTNSVHAPPNLPDDIASLKQLIVEQHTLLYNSTSRDRQAQSTIGTATPCALWALLGTTRSKHRPARAQPRRARSHRGAAFSPSARAAAERAVQRTGAPASACTSAARRDRAHAKLYLS